MPASFPPPPPQGRPVPGRPAALLCDMDGTLVDTEHEWLLTVAELLEHVGAEKGTGVSGVTEFAGLTVADAATRVAACTVLTEADAAGRLDAEFTRRVAAGVRVQPGALELLDAARAMGVPVALVTASERPVADLVLAALGTERFVLSVANGESARGKPHPEPYLAACTRLGVDPADCLAVEDTPTGVRAALAAGCRVLAVPSVPGIEPGPRTTVTDSLRSVRLADFPFDAPAGTALPPA
ncbi:HAD family phosphatase [Streptomyces sp. 549]|uniref:HAD family hydrolase n=1 Tax=Streptomyces sp. 549 TaxID=3049076 RepID=UPI0024C46B16|nr:HAD family phosphatase [Streptomyces sp. 549]MDK1473830.1 HAD family phosphatase [Streptomyces sp. 549]